MRCMSASLFISLNTFRFNMRKLTTTWSDAHLRRTYETSPAHLLVVAPTERELAGLRANRLAGFGVAELGIGRAAAGNLHELLKTRRPKVLLSIGFGGALSGDLSTGDVLVTTEVVSAPELAPLIPVDSELAGNVMNALIAGGIHATRGSTLTVLSPLMSAKHKHRQGILTGASIVDMETYWIAEEALRAGVPFISVRAVIDEMLHELPEFIAHVAADGGQNELRHAIWAMKNPCTVGPLLRLASRSRDAVGTLREVVDILVPVLTRYAPTRVSDR